MLNSMSGHNQGVIDECSQETFLEYSEKDLLAKLDGWTCKDDRDSFSLEEQGLFGNLGCCKLTIKHNNIISEGGRRKKISIPMSDILQFYITRDFEYHSGGKNSPSYYLVVYDLCVVLKSGQHVAFCRLDRLNNTRIFEIVFTQRLGLEKRAVLGAYQGKKAIVGRIYGQANLPQEVSFVTTHVFCPKCKIASDDLQTDDSIDIKHTCRFCGESFDSKFKEYKMKEKPLDKSLSFSIEGKSLVLKRQHKDSLKLCAGLASFFMGLIIVLISSTDFAGIFPALAFPSLVLFMLAGCSFMSYSNSTIITVSDNTINVSVKPFSFLSSIERSLLNSNISQIFVRRSAGSGYYKGSLCALKDDGSEVVLEWLSGTRFDKIVAILQSMEVFIEKRLGIDDKNVSTEILR